MKQIIKEIRLTVTSNDVEQMAQKVPNWHTRVIGKKLSAYTLERLINYLVSTSDQPVEDDERCFVGSDSTEVDLDQLLADLKRLEASNQIQKQQIEQLQQQITRQKSTSNIIVGVLVVLLVAALAGAFLGWF